MTALLCLVVFVAATCIDYAHARYVRALVASERHVAAVWSVAQWGAATVGFVIAARVTLWVLPFEAVGLYLGTLLAVPARATLVGDRADPPRRTGRDPVGSGVRGLASSEAPTPGLPESTDGVPPAVVLPRAEPGRQLKQR